jgi:UDP-N-acetylenolpyruvoylglucosamine reductase
LGSFDGRRIWFVGIGGAGLSGYALLAQAWGAEVAGWDRYETPYLEHVRAAGIAVNVSPSPEGAPEGWEAVVSTAFAGQVPGRTRAELLAELVEQQDAIVVAGAHGKTTTAGMIAFVLDRLGRDPAFLIGAEVPQLGGNARAGSGWLVVEGDESDRTISQLRPKIAVVTNVDLDHHAEFASHAEVDQLFEDWLAEALHAVRGADLEPVAFDLGIPGEHNRRNAAAALAALELAGITPDEARGPLVEFRGAGRRLEPRGEAGGVTVLDDYAHHPAEIEATLAAARSGGRVLVLFQPHLYSRTRHLAHELGRALTAADVVAVGEVYPAREAPVEGVTGKLVVDAAVEARPGMAVAWTPQIEDGARFLARRARCRRRRPGGADPARRARPVIEEHVPLSRFTTVGIGGPARWFARPSTEAELENVLRWAGDEGVDAITIGLGSNLLVADEGIEALVLRLEGELASAATDGDLLVAGGGAANAVCLHRVRAAGLGGFEFACAIPGTVGGGVAMNAGAYGGDWKQILLRARVVSAAGAEWRSPDELGLDYRRSALGAGEVVAGAEFRLTPRPVEEIKVTIAELQAQRKAAQPTNKRTFGSVFKNPAHELSAGRLLEACGLKGHRVGGAQISPRHGNFIENAGDGTATEALALMNEARRRALDRFGVTLEREVRFVGEIELDPL